MGRKLGAVPLLGGAGSQSNTMWPGPRPTCVPCFIFIHPTVWPQYTNVADRQDRTDNGPIVYGEPFYIAQKWIAQGIGLRSHSASVIFKTPALNGLVLKMLYRIKWNSPKKEQNGRKCETLLFRAIFDLDWYNILPLKGEKPSQHRNKYNTGSLSSGRSCR